MAESPFRPLSGAVQEHLAHPRNTGPWPTELAHLTRVAGEAGSRTSGAFVRFYLALEAGQIRGVRYEVLGGPSLMAAASWLSECICNKRASPDQVPPGMDIARELELERSEHGMALLVEDAVLQVLKQAGNGRISKQGS
jgi:NifU-like protein involved in Fe-S cluster formation